MRKLNQETLKDRCQLFCPVVRRALQGSSMLPRHDPGCKGKWSGERHIGNKSFVFQHYPLSSAYFLLKEITEQTPALFLVILTAAPVFRLQKRRDKRQRQQLPVRMFDGGPASRRWLRKIWTYFKRRSPDRERRRSLKDLSTRTSSFSFRSAVWRL